MIGNVLLVHEMRRVVLVESVDLKQQERHNAKSSEGPRHTVQNIEPRPMLAMCSRDNTT